MCSKSQTLAEAQSYFNEITDTAPLTTKDSLDRPWPVVLTNWKYPQGIHSGRSRGHPYLTRHGSWAKLGRQ
jgi:hypothetical protein